MSIKTGDARRKAEGRRAAKGFGAVVGLLAGVGATVAMTTPAMAAPTPAVQSGAHASANCGFKWNTEATGKNTFGQTTYTTHAYSACGHEGDYYRIEQFGWDQGARVGADGWAHFDMGTTYGIAGDNLYIDHQH